MKTENITRAVNESLFNYLLRDIYLKTESTLVPFENDTFLLRPYSWEDEDEKGKNEYHFHHKPSGLRVYWYKYPLRSPQANMDVTPYDFETVLDDCRNSLNTQVTKQLKKWW